MPDQVWIALVGLAGLVLGYFLRPLGELSAEVLRDRLAKGRRREELQGSTLVALGESLEAWRVAASTIGRDEVTPRERVRILTFRVRDDELRKKLEHLLIAEGDDWRDSHSEAVRRLGEVIREL